MPRRLGSRMQRLGSSRPPACRRRSRPHFATESSSTSPAALSRNWEQQHTHLQRACRPQRCRAPRRRWCRWRPACAEPSPCRVVRSVEAGLSAVRKRVQRAAAAGLAAHGMPAGKKACQPGGQRTCAPHKVRWMQAIPLQQENEAAPKGVLEQARHSVVHSRTERVWQRFVALPTAQPVGHPEWQQPELPHGWQIPST